MATDFGPFKVEPVAGSESLSIRLQGVRWLLERLLPSACCVGARTGSVDSGTGRPRTNVVQPGDTLSKIA